MNQPPKIIKLVTDNSNSMYFRIIGSDASTYKLVYLCDIVGQELKFRHRKEVFNHIYKSELGKNYFEVGKDEIERLRMLINERVLKDLQVFEEFYRKKLEMIT